MDPDQPVLVSRGIILPILGDDGEVVPDSAVVSTDVVVLGGGAATPGLAPWSKKGTSARLLHPSDELGPQREACLREAAYTDNVEQAQQLIDLGVNVNCRCAAPCLQSALRKVDVQPTCIRTAFCSTSVGPGVVCGIKFGCCLLAAARASSWLVRSYDKGRTPLHYCALGNGLRVAQVGLGRTFTHVLEYQCGRACEGPHALAVL